MKVTKVSIGHRISELRRFWDRNLFRIKLVAIFSFGAIIFAFGGAHFIRGSLPQQFSVNASAGSFIIVFTVLIVDVLYEKHDRKMRLPSVQAAVDDVRGNIWSILNALDKLFNPRYVRDSNTVRDVMTPFGERLPKLIAFRLEKLATVTESNVQAKTHKELRYALDITANRKDAISKTLSVRSYALSPEVQHSIIEIVEKLDYCLIFISPLPAPIFNLSTLAKPASTAEPPIKANEAKMLLKLRETLKDCADIVDDLVLT